MLVPLLASVQDAERMHEILSTWHPDTVTTARTSTCRWWSTTRGGYQEQRVGHPAHCPDGGRERRQRLRAHQHRQGGSPHQCDGRCKRLAEMALQALAATQAERVEQAQPNSAWCAFGNVLGSSGSVVPKFRQQIREGGPITLTHPEVTRYFMTIPEAAQLVIQAVPWPRGATCSCSTWGSR